MDSTDSVYISMSIDVMMILTKEKEGIQVKAGNMGEVGRGA